MPPFWDQIIADLEDLYLSRARYCGVDGKGISVPDHHGVREPVYMYPTRRRPMRVATDVLANIVSRADVALREENRVGEAAWLDKLLREFAGRSIVRIDDLVLEDFCPADDTIQWLGLDKMIEALRSRCAVWSKRSSPHIASTRRFLVLNRTERDILEAACKAGKPLTTDPLLMLAIGYVNSHGKGVLARLVQRGVLENPKGTKPRGYRPTTLGQDQIRK
jgi:hypothetical protein